MKASLSHFYEDIGKILQEARRKAYVAINSEMVMAYWRIGKRIVEEEQQGNQKAGYGAYLIRELSGRLIKQYGKGYTLANVKIFRQFYLTFPESQIGYAVRSLLTWTHCRSIMRVENPDARKYYLVEAANQNWSTRQLDRNISTLYFERLLSSKKKKNALIKEAVVEQVTPQDLIKDPYVLEFLGIERPAAYSETDLEAGIISNLQGFLLELGKGFSFVGRQYHMKTGSKSYYIDLVFYNFILKCFVLIDLKILFSRALRFYCRFNHDANTSFYQIACGRLHSG
jgi:predicted nuclease of restriction endonuclease-like (RecB) superfamily